MDLQQARLDFAELQKKLCAFNHATALIYLDGQTNAPPDTLANRTHSTEILNEEIFRLKTCPESIALLEFLEENKDELTYKERRTVEFMTADLNRQKNIPADDFVRYGTYLTEAQDAWHLAKEENNYDILAPKLEKVVESMRSFAKYNSPDMDPYEYCVSQYEDGIDIEILERLFNGIRAEITPLLNQISEKPKIDDSCLRGDFPVDAQEEMARYLMELLGVNMHRVGLTTAEHPFTSFLGSHFDERIATRYSENNIASSLYTILNQIGHVLHETGQADNLAFTALDGSASIGLTESQGRFYENIIGRSLPFINLIYPELEELFPDTIGTVSPEELFRAVNKVEPGLNRIDADELTFNLHIMVRYELEKAMLYGDLSVKDLRDAWNQKYKEYLGLDVTDDNSGVLQDIHWPFGAFGYFPIYALGNAFSAQMANKMREDLEIEQYVEEGNFALINFWNKDRIWKYGGLFKSKDIMEKYVGAPINNDDYIRYLKEKYTAIYQL